MSFQDKIERLFLLEILVDNVYIAFSSLNLNPKVISSLKQTCVRFEFLNYPPLEICEEDFSSGKDNYDNNEVNFKTGKSCLFALKGLNPSSFSPPFNIYVTVCKVMANKKSCLIGKTCIKLGEAFATLVSCCVACPSSPTSEIIKDTFPLTDDRNCEVGNITVFIRLSCFGKYIITQFHLGGLENNSYLFRAESENIQNEEPKPKIIVPTQYKDGESISKPKTYCQEIDPADPQHPLSCAPPFPDMGSGAPMMPPMGMMPSMGAGMMPPMGAGMMPPMGPGMMPPMGGAMMPLPMMPASSFNPASMGGNEPGTLQKSDYKELTASVNGHELSIKILRKSKKGHGKTDQALPKAPSAGDKNLKLKENFIVKLGNRPIDNKNPCTTERDTQFVQEDLDNALKLYEELLKEKKGKGAAGGEAKGKKKADGKKGGKKKK